LLGSNRIVKITELAPRLFLSLLAGLMMSQRAGAAVSITPPAPPAPDDGDEFNLYAADQINYDSNLFRLPSNYVPGTTLPVGTAKDDYIDAATLGGVFQHSIGRQTIDVDANADENHYFRHTDLDNTSYTGKVELDWLATSALTGQLRADYNKSLAAFQETLYYGKDLVGTADYFGSANYQLGPHWGISGFVRQTDITHSAPQAQYGDFKLRSGDGAVKYTADVDESFQFVYSYNNGSYGQNYIFNGLLTNRDYHENTEQLQFQYPITGKTLLSGYGGYLERDFQQASLGKYQGDIWRINVDWKPRDKIDLLGSVWHELHSYSTSEADYFVSKGFSIAPAYTATDKLTFSFLFSIEDQDFIPSSESVLLTGARSDRITGEQINALYEPLHNLFVNVFFRHEQRASNQGQFDYLDELANASITYKFL
jgi:exopolysaccharide biosynthesis operon protein EpsL